MSSVIDSTKGRPLVVSITELIQKEDDKTEKKEGKPYEVEFSASAQQIIDKGWMNIYPFRIEESNLPLMSGKVNIDEIKFEEKQTQPPNRYSSASLVSILEKKNLGTKATRSMIVETLFDRGYVEYKSIQATPLGIRLIETLEKY